MLIVYRRLMKRVLVVLLVVVLATVGGVWISLPDVTPLETHMPTTTAFMDQRRAQLRRKGKDDTLLYQPVPYDRISPYLRRGALVAEDDDFYEHSGVDVKAMQEALRRDLKRKKLTHGGSTITQQLAKNLYLSSSRNPLRKIREYFIARSLERHLSKKRILELYLNVVEMGERVYGAEAASRYYFHVPASALSTQQAALLAGCLPNPRVMNPGAPNKRLRARQAMILSRLRRWGYSAEREVLAAPPAASPSGAGGSGGAGGAGGTSGTSDTTGTAETLETTETTDTSATATASTEPPPPPPPTTTTQ